MYIQYVDVFTLVHIHTHIHTTCVRQLSTLNTFVRRVPVSVRLSIGKIAIEGLNSVIKMRHSENLFINFITNGSDL